MHYPVILKHTTALKLISIYGNMIKFVFQKIGLSRIQSLEKEAKKAQHVAELNDASTI